MDEAEPFLGWERVERREPLVDQSV